MLCRAQVQCLGQEDPLEEGIATHASVLAWRIPGTGDLVGCRLWGHTELGGWTPLRPLRGLQESRVVALHSMAHSFIELDKAVVHVISLISFL